MKPTADRLAEPRIDRRLWPVLAGYWTLLVIATHLPGSYAKATAGLIEFDKLIHLTAYAVLGCLLAVCVTPRGGRLGVATAGALWLVVTSFGACDELTQSLVGRSCELYDFLADAVGAASGIGAYALWTRWRG
ncbi:MAG: VanZ family protein [Planctomycetota bacterium]